MIFNSIQDYTEFMTKNLTRKQLNQLEKYLKNNITHLFENKVKIYIIYSPGGAAAAQYIELATAIM